MPNKRERKNTSPKQPRSRAKYQCPNELNEIIAESNKIPADVVDLPKWDYFYEKIKEDYLTEEGNSEYDMGFVSEIKFQTLEKVFSLLPEDLKDHLNEKVNCKFESINRASLEKGEDISAQLEANRHEWLVHYYRFYEHNRSNLRAIAKHVADRRAGKPLGFFSVDLHYSAEINENNKLAPKAKGLAALLVGIDLDRIRFCEVCGKLFWAGRQDSKTCSDKCSNRLRQRRFIKK
jgi:hypothetical protein